jgi:hypothetical protein
MNGRAVPRNSSEQCSDVAAATEEKASPTMTALIEQLNRDLDELQTTLLGGNKGGSSAQWRTPQLLTSKTHPNQLSLRD